MGRLQQLDRMSKDLLDYMDDIASKEEFTEQDYNDYRIASLSYAWCRERIEIETPGHVDYLMSLDKEV